VARPAAPAAGIPSTGSLPARSCAASSAAGLGIHPRWLPEQTLLAAHPEGRSTAGGSSLLVLPDEGESRYNPLQINHLSYRAYNETGRTPLEDVEVLCQPRRQ
jgi:hypothetical protein